MTTMTTDDGKNSDQQFIVRDWRYKLQKAFLSSPLNPEEMPELDQLFTIVENHDMTFEQLKFSKIGKVMRHISVIPDGRLPRDDEFNFRMRATILIDEWLKLLKPPLAETAEYLKETRYNVEEITQVTGNLKLNSNLGDLDASEMAGLDTNDLLLAESPLAEKDSTHDKNKGADSNSDFQAIIVRDWRNKLQSAFLSSKVLPKPDVMPQLDQLFTIVENYDGMTIQQLQFSKIGKVMRHISIAPNERLPRDDEFNFRMRATRLVEKWQKMLSSQRREYWTSENEQS